MAFPCLSSTCASCTSAWDSSHRTRRYGACEASPVLELRRVLTSVFSRGGGAFHDPCSASVAVRWYDRTEHHLWHRPLHQGWPSRASHSVAPSLARPLAAQPSSWPHAVGRSALRASLGHAVTRSLARPHATADR